MSEDEARKAHDDATELVHAHEKAIDEVLKHKTAEIMEV
jgi:ribosome recycling factor